MHIEVKELDIEGCYSAKIANINDQRGNFLKAFHESSFQKFVPKFLPKEVYVTRSKKNVVRGMHFQLPPDDHTKIVVCLAGKVTDVLVDLREGTGFGTVCSAVLTSNSTNCMIIPRGIAHGFCAHEDDSTLLYLVDSVHSPTNDIGISWNSIDFKWPIIDPIISPRDLEHRPLSDFSQNINWTKIDY